MARPHVSAKAIPQVMFLVFMLGYPVIIMARLFVMKVNWACAEGGSDKTVIKARNA